MRSGPVVIAFDGSPTALRALRDAAELFAPRAGLVVVVWEAGAAYDFATIPSASLELPPAQLDLRRGPSSSRRSMPMRSGWPGTVRRSPAPLGCPRRRSPWPTS
jgi:hypothetical protein